MLTKTGPMSFYALKGFDCLFLLHVCALVHRIGRYQGVFVALFHGPERKELVARCDSDAGPVISREGSRNWNLVFTMSAFSEFDGFCSR
jgi:hypothetical protein